MANTRDEVIAAIAVAFPGSDATAMLAVLDLYGAQAHERERERVQLAVIALSEGNEDKLLYFLNIAKNDYRDVLHWAANGPLTQVQGEKQRQAALRLIERWGKK